MWDKIKSILLYLLYISVITYIFYFLFEINNSLGGRITQLELNSSYQKTDIIQLNTADDGLMSTLNIRLDDMLKSNEVFKEETMKDINHKIGMMESKLDRLQYRYESISKEFNMKDELLRESLSNIVATTDTLKIDNKKGTQSLQEQFEQLRLEFDQLIMKLKTNRKTKSIFGG